MTDNDNGRPLACLGDLMQRYGERWQITRNQSPPCWMAVERPTPTALRVLAAHDLAELDAKIRNASGD